MTTRSLAARIALALAIVAIASACTGSPPAPPAATSSAGGATPAAGSQPLPTGVAAASAAASPAAAGWRRIADIPTARSEVAATVHQLDTVYVIGGFGGPARVERYDPSGKWERLADLPHGVDHAMAASVSGIQVAGDEGVYVLGGYADGVATARSFRFDPATGRWNEIAAMPGPRAAAAAVAINARIYVVGGAEGGRLVSPTYEYDVTTRRWRSLAAIPTPRDHLAAVEMYGQVCAVGGRRLSLTANLGTLECYLPQTDRWESLPNAPTPRGGVGAAHWDGRIYLIGGEQPSGTFKEVEIYDSRARTWSRGPDLPTPRHGLGVVAAGGTSRQPSPAVYALTGGPTPGGSQTAVCEVLTLR